MSGLGRYVIQYHNRCAPKYSISFSIKIVPYYTPNGDNSGVFAIQSAVGQRNPKEMRYKVSWCFYFIFYIIYHSSSRLKFAMLYVHVRLGHLPSDKSVYLKIIFLISQPELKLWVLKRTVSMRWFFWAHKTHVWTDGYENNYNVTFKKSKLNLCWMIVLVNYLQCRME